MTIVYLFAILNIILVPKTIVAEVTSTCVPSITRPGRPLPCSSNLDCECFNLATDNIGICAAALISCSNLHPCDLNQNRTCSIPNTVCVASSRCNQPVCYPLALASPQVCPPNSSVAPLLSSTTTPAPPTTTNPYRIKTTYPIFGTFDTVIINGNQFVVSLIQLLGQNPSPYLEILNTMNASSPVSINNSTQTLTLSNLNNVIVTLYFKTLKQVISNEYFDHVGTIDIVNLNTTNITLGTNQKVNVTATHELNVLPGCCGITNVSSLTNVNVILAAGGWPNITVMGENVSVRITGGGVPQITIKAKNTANIFTAGIPTCNIEAGNFINITTTGISKIYAKASTSTMSANMMLDGISTVYMGVGDNNGTKTGYACPKTVTMTLGGSSTVYVCATEKINANGYGGNVYYQGAINDTRGYGSRIPF